LRSKEGRRCLRERADVGNLRVVADEVAGFDGGADFFGGFGQVVFGVCAIGELHWFCERAGSDLLVAEIVENVRLVLVEGGVCAGFHVGDLEDGEAVVAGAGHLDDARFGGESRGEEFWSCRSCRGGWLRVAT